MNILINKKSLGLLSALATIIALPVHADLITNGGFEAGFSGWTLSDQIGGDGGFSVQSGISSPVNGFPVPTPPGGSFAAFTDAQGPGSHVMYQDFLVPTTVSGTTINFSLFLNNGALDYFSPPTLDFAATNPTGLNNLNQQVRVDILSTSADVFGITTLQNLFTSNPGDALISGYTTYSADISALLLAHQGETLRLRFAETDNVSFLNLGVDDVSILTATTTVPEPATLFMLLFVWLAGLGLPTPIKAILKSK